MKVGDLVRWQRFPEEPLPLDTNDIGIIFAIDIWELSKDDVIVGVHFSRIGFVWCNPQSLEVLDIDEL